jgi:hypothetical protein
MNDSVKQGLGVSEYFEAFPPPPRQSTRFLKRHILPSDNHGFVGRLYDLGIVTLNFDSYEDLVGYADCKYAVDVLDALQRLTRRMESLNLVGNLLWPEPFPKDFRGFPISQYDWLVVTADVFLMRYISVVDCALLLVNEIFESSIERHLCTLVSLRKKGVRASVLTILEDLIRDQGALRAERNARVHHGEERTFTIDDTTFKVAAMFNRQLNGMVGHDYYGRPINVQRSFREGLVLLQRTFNRTTRRLVRQLDRLYDELWEEFEARFGPRIAAATHGLNAGSKRA